MKHLDVNGVSKYENLVEDVASFLAVTLNEKVYVHIIRWKLSHLCDIYRHYKVFIFHTVGVSYNSHANKIKIRSKYWRSIEELCVTFGSYV